VRFLKINETNKGVEMNVVKKTKEWSIVKKRSGRFGVKTAEGTWLKADEKVKVLLAEGLIKVSEPSAPKAAAEEEQAPVEQEAVAEAPAEDAGE